MLFDLNAGGMETFPVLAEVETLMIAVDHDSAGEKAATTVCRRWSDAGREVLLVRSTESKNDLNDEIKQVSNDR